MLRLRHCAPAALPMCLGLALAGPASGAITVGTGHTPNVAVDAAGTAYLAWSGTENNRSLQFCRLPRGAAGCAPGYATTITAPGTSLQKPFLVVSGSRVVIVQQRYGEGVPGFSALYAFRSTNGGVSFAAGEVIGSVTAFEALPGPGDTVSVVASADAAGGAFQNTPLDGTAPVVPSGPGAGRSMVPVAQLWGGDHPYNGAVGLVDAATPLVTYSDGSGMTQFRRYKGAGTLNDAANWTTPVDVGTFDGAKLASGPAGLFLLGVDANGNVVSRRFDGTTFGPPAFVGSTGSAFSLHVVEDAGGRLQLTFRRQDIGGIHVIHAVSDDGATWRSGILATQTLDTGGGDVGAPRIAAAADHVGVVVWEALGTNAIRVAGSGPDAPVDPKPVAPAPVPSPRPAPIAQPLPKVTATPPPTRRTSVTVAGGRVTLTSPRGCVPVGSSFRATLSFKRSTRKGALFVKVTRVDFLVDGKLRKADRAVPFRQTLSVKALKAGSKHALRARASIKVRTGHSPRKSIRTSFTVCG